MRHGVNEEARNLLVVLGALSIAAALLSGCGGGAQSGLEPGVGGNPPAPGAFPEAPARADGRCRYQPECYLQGKCSQADDPKSNACVAKLTEDCQRSQECAALGRCAPQGGVCIPSAEGCTKSLACWESGLCALGPNAGACAATDVTQCQQSELCAKEAKCSLADWHCILGGSLDCVNSGLCRKLGKCDDIRGECHPTRDEHCGQSEICQQQHLCKEVNSECIDEKLEAH
jgi:hypothetical protein